MKLFPTPCLAVLTDRTHLTPNWTLAQAVAPAITGGANLVIYRETDLPANPRTSVYRFLEDGVRGRVPLIAQGRAEWAAGVAADGVHLEDADTPIEAARRILGQDRLIGVTVTGLEQAASMGHAAHYVLIYVDWSEPASALEVVRRYAAASQAPLIVGQDVPVEHAAACISAGAAGVCIVEAAMSAYDKTGATRQYAKAIGIHK